MLLAGGFELPSNVSDIISTLKDDHIALVSEVAIE